MILEEIVLQDFGLYAGKQVFDLRPASPNRPIVLIGGTNGGGKTTLLDALQLALYGKLASCSNRGDLAYDEFLARSVHRTGAKHAAIELTFSHTEAGTKHSYHVRRAWSLQERSERLEVHHGGGFDPVLTDEWSDHIEGLLPLRLSRFFFFDGEKIESLADLEKSADVLSTAVHSLLGLDLVDQVTADLQVLERRKRAEQKSEEEKEELARIETNLAALKERQQDLVQKRATAQNTLDRAAKRARTAESRYEQIGGAAFEKRKEIEGKKHSKEERLAVLDDELREVAAQAAPLMLVVDLLEMAVADAEAERASTQAQGVGELLEGRDKKALDAARKAGAPDHVVKALREYFNEDRERRKRAARGERYLDLSTEGYAALGSVMTLLGDETKERIRHLITQAERLEEEIEGLNRKLDRAPKEEDAIAKAAEERAEAKQAFEQAERAIRDIDEEADRVGRDLITLTRKKETALETSVEEERAARMVQRSEQMRRAFGRFRTKVVQHHGHRLEELILDSFQQILRKKSLIAGLRIDPDTFGLALVGQGGQTLLPERLSAGERQLLAISTIWGLARASGRPLPVVIDTPLGRLDSVHRQLLVERYFPNASHQVILLSTDEEIDEALHRQLEPYISRTYRLDYDDRAGTTKIAPGYFWPR
ncbi:MAG TPA: DNA sulfur modification protein DndD [Polyangium sp.]|nr:DNA sulfur modification protein DndD [Polyangium sp.]